MDTPIFQFYAKVGAIGSLLGLSIFVLEVIRRILDVEQRWRSVLSAIVPWFSIMVAAKSCRPSARPYVRIVAMVEIAILGVTHISPIMVYQAARRISAQSSPSIIQLEVLKPEYPHIALSVEVLTDSSTMDVYRAVKVALSGKWFHLEPIVREVYGTQIGDSEVQVLVRKLSSEMFITIATNDPRTFYIQSDNIDDTKIPEVLLKYAQSRVQNTLPPSMATVFMDDGTPVSLRFLATRQDESDKGLSEQYSSSRKHLGDEKMVEE